jgi:hypothetical protein
MKEHNEAMSPRVTNDELYSLTLGIIK